MLYNKDTNEILNKKDEVIGDLKNGEVVMREGFEKLKGVTTGQLAKAGIIEKKAPKKKAVVQKPSPPKEEKVKDGTIKVITPSALAHNLKDVNRIPNTGFIFKERLTGLEIRENNLIKATQLLSSHRFYKCRPKEECELLKCRMDILTYTAQRCDPSFLKM